MKYQCVESTLDITLYELHGDQPATIKTLRLWIDIGEVKSIMPAMFGGAVKEIQARAARMQTHQLFEWLPTVLPALNAAQLIRTHPGDPDLRVGMMVYYVPFDAEPAPPKPSRWRRFWDLVWDAPAGFPP